MRKNELVLMGHIKQNIPQFTSGSCNCDNHSVTLFTFTTAQSEIYFFKTLRRGTPSILFQPSHLHFY